jgi:hypothetical protein
MDAFPDINPVPLDVAKSWPLPNYVNPERRGPALLIINCVLLPLALVVVVLRLYTRLTIARSQGLDDLFIALASVNPLNPNILGLWLTCFLIPAIGLTVSVCLGKTSNCYPCSPNLVNDRSRN